MRNLFVLVCTVLLCAGNLKAYVTNNQGTVGSPGTFVSILDPITNKIIGYVDCTGFDLTHPIDISINSTNNKAYVTCDTVNSVFVIDISTQKVIGKVDDTLNPFVAPAVLDINFNVLPNIAYVSNEAGSTGNRGSVNIVNLSVDLVTGKVDDTLGPVNLPIGVSISDDGTKLLIANFNGNSVSAVNTATNAVTGYINDAVHAFVSPVLVGWSGSTKAYVSNLGTGGMGFVNVVVGNAVTGPVSGIPLVSQPVNIVEGPDGFMYITDTTNHTVYLVDPTTDAVIATLSGTFSAPLGIGFSLDNKTAYIANSGNNTVSIVDIASRTQTGVVDASAFPFFVPYQIGIFLSPPLPPTPPAPPPPVPPVPPVPPSTSHPLQPMCIHGNQKTNRFATQSELYNTITWCPSPSLSVVGYNLYRNGVLIKTFNLHDELVFEEHDSCCGTTVYTVKAVGSTGLESLPVTISID